MTEPRTYYLPWPIGTNNRLASVNGRQILTTKARRWYALAGEELGLQRPERVKGPVALLIRLCPPNRRRFDIDNRAKSTIDALVKNAIIEGDDCSIVQRITLELTDEGANGPGAYVTVAPLCAEQAEAA